MTHIDGVYDPHATAEANIAGAIRATHDGMLSDFPRGIRYPGVPSVAEVCESLGIDPIGPLSESDWFRVWDRLES